jgi:hypothetical protein
MVRGRSWWQLLMHGGVVVGGDTHHQGKSGNWYPHFQKKLGCGDGHHRGKLVVVTATTFKKFGLW